MHAHSRNREARGSDPIRLAVGAARRDMRTPKVVAPRIVARGTRADNRAPGLALADEFSTVALRGGLLVRVGRDLEPAVQRELLENVVDVTLDRVGRDVEALCDFLVAQ